uniref:Enhancer of polycomb-like protein n=1 Tax=Ditylum brightwellii TaxID=49249 RepID=A0A7S2EGN1_9STRA
MMDDCCSTTSDDMDDLNDDNINISTLRRRPRLTISVLEAMLDLLEKATGFETIITSSQAERLLVSKLPVLLHMFGTAPKNKTDLKAAAAAAAARKRKRQKQLSKTATTISTNASDSTTANDNNDSWNESDVPTVRSVVQDVYNYWVQKRSKLKRPLLRKYWPVTSSNDTNPHMVFRPREKEKYKLRKKRQNDMDSYRKMKQLRSDFDRVRTLLTLVKKREEINMLKLELGCEVFEQRMYDALNTSGLPRKSGKIRKSNVEKILDVPKYFDTSSVSGHGGGSKKKKRRRSSGGNNGGDRGTSPTPGVGGVGNASSTRNRRCPSPTPISGTDDLNTSSAVTPLIAGQDHGTPAPLFLHPLASRESYVTSWDNAVPFVSSYSGGHAMPTFRFRHRPRVGRGGRIIIDRLPCPGGTGVVSSGGLISAPVNVYTAGDGLPRFAKGGSGDGGEDGVGEKKRAAIEDNKGGSNNDFGAGPADRLTDLLPPPLDRARISRRIEEICAEALSDDENDGPITGRPASALSSSSVAGGAGAGGGGAGGGIGSSSASSSGGGGGGMGHSGASGSASGGGGGVGSGAGGTSSTLDIDENDGDELLIRVNDWLETDEQIWGEERFVIGPV